MELKHTILSADSDAMTIKVLFENPYYSGTFKVMEDFSSTDADGEPTTEQREVDNDPNPHATKTINVPVVDGKVDKDALEEIIKQQAQGVKNRMESAYQTQSKKIDLTKALGL
jgi:hypothetical protein